MKKRIFFTYYPIPEIRFMSPDYIYIYTNTFLTLILKIINKLFKRSFTAIFNPFTSHLHVIDFETFEKLDNTTKLFRHEYVHFIQIQLLGRFKFLYYYLKDFIKYKNYNLIRLEKIAYELENNTDAYTIFQIKIIQKTISELYKI